MDQQEQNPPQEQVLQHQETANQQQQISRPTLNKVILFPDQFDWKLAEFNQQNAIKNFSKLAEEDINTTHQQNEKLHIAESAIKNAGITKTNVYILRGDSQTYGKVEIVRKYSDFYQLREALVRRWPAVFIPPIPEKGNIGTNQKQIAKNKLEILNHFLRRIICKQPIFTGQQFENFIKSPQQEVSKNLQKLKPRNIEELLTIYKTNWSELFGQVSEQHIQHQVNKINRFQEYFMQVKIDLVRHKDQMKRLAELKSKLNSHRYQIMCKTLPQYEGLCLNWFNNTTNNVGKNKTQKIKQKVEGIEEEIKRQDGKMEEGKIYSSERYQQLLQAYKQDIFQQKFDQRWIMYELFKFQIREIDAILQAVTHYKYLINDKKYYMRNVENNKQQIQDINNKKMSFKIFFLSGTEDDKKTQLANQTVQFENRLKICEDLWNGATQLMVSQIEEFQTERCEHYKKNLMFSFKKQALLMSKLFNLYVEAQKLCL